MIASATYPRSYTVDLEGCGLSAIALVGGKCARLGEVMRGGGQVPPGFAVTTEAYEAFLASAGLQDRLHKALAGVDAGSVESTAIASVTIRELFEATPVPGAVVDAIRAAYELVGERCRERGLVVAVRSSATLEDSGAASFAGQQDTYLGVRGADAVVAHVVRCWASLFTPQAMSYRSRMGLTHDNVRMGVAVQQMVDAKVGGVLFTVNPLNGDRSKIIAEACWGLGEGVVKGDLSPDRYVIDKVTLAIVEKVVTAKEIEYRFDPLLGRVSAVAVGTNRREVPCLTDDQVVELAQLAKGIEQHFGGPQDIEWAIHSSGDAGGGLHVLQVRPETVWSRRPREPLVDVGQSLRQSLYDLIGRGIEHPRLGGDCHRPAPKGR